MAGWNIISAISNEHNLLPEEKYTMGAGRVSDTMNEEAKTWFTGHSRPSFAPPHPSPPSPILIKAPTGSGKSTFVMQDLLRILRKQIPYGRILLLTNRKALCLQQRMIGNANINLPRLGTTALLGNSIWDGIDIISYQEAYNYISYDYYNTISYIEVVVCDEAHFFCSDSTYNAHTSEILKLIIQKFFFKQRIYMTATPHEVKPILSFEERQEMNSYIYSFQQSIQELRRQQIDGNDKKIQVVSGNLKQFASTHKFKIYEYPDDFSYVHLHFVHEWGSIIRSIKDTPDEKWLVFVSTNQLGEKLKKEIGSSATFFNADTKGEDKKDFQDLIRREYFDGDVLISTTVLYNGVNFNDERLKHIVADSISEVELIQMLGRKRLNRKEGETINLYVMVPREKDISSRLNLIKSNMKIVESFQHDPSGFFRDRWEKQNVNDNLQKLFGVPYSFQGSFISMSLYAPYGLAIQEGTHETCLDALNKGNHAFEDLVCSWLQTKYSADMKYDEDLEDLKEKIMPDVIACFEKYREEPAFSQEIGKVFWQEIYDIIMPINEILNYRFRRFEKDGGSRWQADINGISDIFDLPYIVKGGAKTGHTVKMKNEKPEKPQSTDESDNSKEIPLEIEEGKIEEE